MKSILLILLFCAGMSYSNSLEARDTSFYLIRHAEKQKDGTKDPSITKAGLERAKWIARYLSDKKITAIYSTNYKRTQETAAPTAQSSQINITSYDPRKLQTFAEELKSKTENALIVGHSNTTPYLASFLSGLEVQGLSEDQYDHIFIVKMDDHGTMSLKVEYSEPRN